VLRADRPAPTRGELLTPWVQTAVLLVALAALLSGFRLVVEGWGWWWTSVGVMTASLLGCAVARAVRLPPAVVGVVVWFVVLAATFAPSTTIAGLVPTPSTVPALLDVGRQAGRVVVEEVAPVDPVAPISFVLAAAFGLLAIVLDALLVTLASAVGVGVVWVGMYVCPALIVGREPSLTVFVLVAALWLLLLRLEDVASVRGAPLGVHRVPATAIAVGALALSVLLPTALPRVATLASDWGGTPPEVFSRGVNPMLELGSNLRRGATVTSLEYTTTADQAQYLRVATLRDFDGTTWEPSGPARFGVDERPDDDADERDDVEAVRTSVRIRELDSSRLPVPYPVQSVQGLEGTWRLDEQGLTLSSRSATTDGQSYVVRSVPRTPTEDEVRSAGRPDGLGVRPYLELPAMPDVIESTARRVTAGAGSDYDRAMALQSYFRDGSFEYSETAPVEDGYDGNGVEVIAEFLEARSGYCVHFASSMAVMARSLGIPSRVVVGFAPGERIGTEDGLAVYANTSDTLHAWPELYFDDVGWVGFDPTPGIGSATDLAEEETTETGPDATATPTPTTPTETPGPRRDEADRAQGTDAADEAGPTPVPLLGAGLVLLLVLAVPGVTRSVRRRLRLRRAEHAVAPAWDELLDTAYDLGVPARPDATPREQAALLATAPGARPAAVDRMLVAYERERFGRPGSEPAPDVRADLHTATHALRAAAGRAARWRAAVLPRSLTGRRDTGEDVDARDQPGARLDA
jgi:transglutaminase-like putative cysteine protease